MILELPIEIPTAKKLFRSVWKYAFVVGFITAIAVTANPQVGNLVVTSMFLIAVGFGALIGLLHCFGIEQKREQLPPEPIDFTSNLWLHLREHAPSTKQLDLFEKIVEDPKERRRVFAFRAEGKEMFIVSSERYHELLVSRIGEDVDKATEHALVVGFKRLQGETDPSLRPLLNKLFREIVKADFRGNLFALMAQQGAKLEAELKKIAAPPKELEKDFSLEPIGPKGRRRAS